MVRAEIITWRDFKYPGSQATVLPIKVDFEEYEYQPPPPPTTTPPPTKI